ncbi:baeRF7 domain-containing protein [Neolewinella antarctica]|uniref:Uncharacterized protein n=1 Tax=Neolewinella antarctica TaxID=442734 RepID=A0ABX0X8G3_9BACT|nr:hypothetical protein [Neolewinella antarctica]NJC25538.1 hypothetical protein [Neolewinella antarctica]
MLTQQQFDTLATTNGDSLISIYVPTSPVGSEEKDRIRLKNAIQKATNDLESRGMTNLEATEYLTKGTNLVEDFDFSEDSSNGLAVFIGKDVFETITLRSEVAESVKIGTAFMLAPLVKELNGAGDEFFLLTLSRGGCKLFLARDGQLDAIETTGIIPVDMEAALLLDDPNRQLQRSGRSDRPGTVSGHGAGKDTENAYVKEYFDIVDGGVATLLKNETRPLLLAGVTELIPIYREANQYTHLIEDRYVSGNVDQEATTDLHKKAADALGGFFTQQKERDHELYGLNLAKGEAGSNLMNIVPAAINGRIAVLWVVEGSVQYGHYEAATNGVELTDDRAPGATELYNLAIVSARKSGARVYITDAESLPKDGGQVCAIYRYGIPAVITNLG